MHQDKTSIRNPRDTWARAALAHQEARLKALGPVKPRRIVAKVQSLPHWGGEMQPDGRVTLAVTDGLMLGLAQVPRL